LALDIIKEISESLERGDFDRVAALTLRAIDANIPAKEILDLGLLAGMKVVAEKFRTHEIFLPDVLLAAKAMYAGMALLEPLMIKGSLTLAGKVVLGTVQGDVHDIGKNLVGIMLRGAGFEIVDLGNDVPPKRFIDVALEVGASVIGLSALLTTTMPAMKRVVEQIKTRSLSDKIKVIIGGAPVTADYALEIGADAYAFDGVSAVDRIKKLMGVI
jgi:5-methyltetrahydrofolate--homocysteine methyltransferase